MLFSAGKIHLKVQVVIFFTLSILNFAMVQVEEVQNLSSMQL
jgi:hypothetical protein